MVQRTAVSMGYIAPPQGVRRRRSATRTVGVLVSVNELHNRFMTLLLEYIHHDMLEFGYHVMVLIDAMNSATDATHLSTFRPVIDGYLDGMILGSATTDSVLVRELQRLGVPTVLVVRSVEGMHVDIIEADNARGGAEIMKHFHELGHLRIGLVMGPDDASTSRDRARGALQYLRGVGVAEHDTPVMWNAFTSDAGYSCAVQMLSEPNHVTAIMAGSDSIALGVLEAARAKEILVPEELSVAGFDDVPLSGSRLISLTTIHNPVKEMARTACRRMVERIRNGGLTPPTRDVLPTRLVRRDTSAPPPRSGDGPARTPPHLPP